MVSGFPLVEWDFVYTHRKTNMKPAKAPSTHHRPLHKGPLFFLELPFSVRSCRPFSGSTLVCRSFVKGSGVEPRFWWCPALGDHAGGFCKLESVQQGSRLRRTNFKGPKGFLLSGDKALVE